MVRSDLELDRLQIEGIHAHDPRLELRERRPLVAAAHFAQADDALVGDQFEDGPQEIARVDAGVVPQHGVHGNGHGADLQVDDLHAIDLSMMSESCETVTLSRGSACYGRVKVALAGFARNWTVTSKSFVLAVGGDLDRRSVRGSRGISPRRRRPIWRSRLVFQSWLISWSRAL